MQRIISMSHRYIPAIDLGQNVSVTVVSIFVRPGLRVRHLSQLGKGVVGVSAYSPRLVESPLGGLEQPVPVALPCCSTQIKLSSAS